MYELGATLLNKSGAPYFSKGQSDQFMNIAQNNWVSSVYRQLEETQEMSDKLLPLKTSFTFTQKTQLVLPPNSNADIPNYWHMIGVQGKYTYKCASGDKYEWIAIRPLQLKDEPTLRSDPFNNPTTTRNLWYKEVDGNIIFVAPSAIDVNGSYLAIPNTINSVGQPNVSCQFINSNCQDIVRMAVVLMMLNVGMNEEAKNFQELYGISKEGFNNEVKQ